MLEAELKRIDQESMGSQSSSPANRVNPDASDFSHRPLSV